jgi:hypothetical protein
MEPEDLLLWSQKPLTAARWIYSTSSNLAIGSFTVNGLQRGIDQMVKYCGDWNLKCNLQKTKILVFKKEGKLKKNEKWFMYDQLI